MAQHFSPAFVIACLIGSISPTGGTTAEPPNVVLILADDLGRNDLGAYGGRETRTPNIDRLAAEGMRFDAAFVTVSSCSPSRASLITGRYPHRTDAEQLHWALPEGQVTFVEKLRVSGYWTAAAGKWHLGEAAKKRFDLVKEADPSGFQLPSGASAGEKLHAIGDGSGCEEWVATLQTRPKDRPFFLWLAALDPHRDYAPGAIDRPHTSQEIEVPPYLPDVPEVRRDFALYRDEVTRLDCYVGKVLGELDRQGVADETVIIFLSDNGRAFPREKTTLYDAGIATPLIIRGPGCVRAGSVCHALASTVDLAPTILRIAGSEVDGTFDGESLLPLLEGSQAKVHDYVFAEDHWHDFEDHARAVRSGRYKFIRNDYLDLPNTPPADALRSPTFEAMRRLRDERKLNAAQLACFVSPRPAEEFYDLESDPHELKNLAQDPWYAEPLAEHRRALASWTAQTKDVLPQRRTPDEFDRETGQPLPSRVRPRPSKAEMQAAGM